MLEHRYDVPLRFTGKINKLIVKLEAPGSEGRAVGRQLIEARLRTS
jgi:hypothetical protein